MRQSCSKRVHCLTQSLTHPTKVAVGRAFVLNKAHPPRISKCGYGQLVIAAASQSATLSKSHAQDAASSEASTPKQLSKYVAELKLSVEGRPVQVYVVGVSHVSRQSCSHVAQMIAAVSPEAVLLELCKDRVQLLMDPSAPPPQHWHTRAIDLQGMLQSSDNAWKKLLLTLKCQRGRAFTAHDIEEDCVQLLASGAFASVVPITQPASTRDAPLFVPGKHQVCIVQCGPIADCCTVWSSGNCTELVAIHTQDPAGQADVPLVKHRPALALQCDQFHRWHMSACPVLHICPGKHVATWAAKKQLFYLQTTVSVSACADASSSSPWQPAVPN